MANYCLKKGNDMKKLTCFKAYDIRGKLGEELNEDIALGALVAPMANFSNRKPLC